MDQVANPQHGQGGWARKAPPKVSFEQCHTPTGRLTSSLSAHHETGSPMATGGLQRKPSVRTRRPRKSLVELTYAERNPQEVPLSPLASKASPKDSLQSPTGQVQRKPFRNTSRNRISYHGVPTPPAKVGNKKAVLINANYKNTEGVRKLESCSSLSSLYDLLVLNLGFSRENVWVLTEEPRAVPGAATFSPTRANIVNGMRWLVSNSSQGDQLMFSFSGHGCRVVRNTHPNGIDDCILPSDYPTSNPIAENEINEILVQNLRNGATLTTLFDCRNSARLMKLPYVHVMAKRAKGTFFLREEFELPNAVSGSARGVVLKSVLRFSRIKKENLDLRKKVAEERRNTVAAACFDNGTVICITASSAPEDDSSSIASAPANHGALTSAFVSYMRYSATQKNKPSYSSVLCAMSSWLFSNGGDRLPQLSSTHNVSPDMTVTLL